MAGSAIEINEHKRKERQTAIAQNLERDVRGRSQGRKMKKKWIEENMEKEGRGTVIYTHIDRHNFK